MIKETCMHGKKRPVYMMTHETLTCGNRGLQTWLERPTHMPNTHTHTQERPTHTHTGATDTHAKRALLTRPLCLQGRTGRSAKCSLNLCVPRPRCVCVRARSHACAALSLVSSLPFILTHSRHVLTDSMARNAMARDLS